MKNVEFTDVTLLLAANNGNGIGFKEKVQIARDLSSLNVHSIQFPAVNGQKENAMLISTVSAFLTNTVISQTANADLESVEEAAAAVKSANKPRISVNVPASAVQMEYFCHKKPKAMLELITKLISTAKESCADVEFCALDATRAEEDFLKAAITAAINAGATRVCLCDDAGNMLPQEFGDFVDCVVKYCTVPLAVFPSNEINMATACAISALSNGAVAVNGSFGYKGALNIAHLVKIITAKGDKVGFTTDIDVTNIARCYGVVKEILRNAKEKTASVTVSDDGESVILTQGDDSKKVAAAAKSRGYDLNSEDVLKVFNAVSRLPQGKTVTGKELDAIVATYALQVPETYKLKSYVINSGNIISATANICLVKDDKEMQGICVGDGPIDASFMAIEQIIGHHYELDDFQIQAVTEGRQAMGGAVVRLRADGVIYSGRGLSTDIIGASIYAYLNAINKIAYGEGI